jgi:hypothetical protein
MNCRATGPASLRDSHGIGSDDPTPEFTSAQFDLDSAKYDFVLCANVLSAIPSPRIRTRIARTLARRLTVRGKCFYVCQYTNSYFCDQMADESVRKYSDGFIKGTAENASFYGIIRPPMLQDLIRRAGFSIRESWIHDQSGYVVAERCS